LNLQAGGAESFLAMQQHHDSSTAFLRDGSGCSPGPGAGLSPRRLGLAPAEMSSLVLLKLLLTGKGSCF